MRVLRYYHGGRDRSHRARDRALAAAGAEIFLAVPTWWPDAGSEVVLSDEPFEMVQFDVRRAGDVNRHHLANRESARSLLGRVRPDVVDVHAEPFSLIARDWLAVAGSIPVTMYTAQNVDKRFPPPFAQYEAKALRRVNGMYPCTRQAAAVARGKGFGGPIAVLPLGVDPAYAPGRQTIPADRIELGIVGRLVPEKGVLDAVRVLAAVSALRPAHLHVTGDGPEAGPAKRLARTLGVLDSVSFSSWQHVDGLAEMYRELHVLLVPSTSTDTWTEQFGRTVLEGMASGAVVAAYDSGAIAEVSGGAAVLAPEGAAAALGSAVSELVTDPQRFDRLRSSGIRRAGVATWDNVAKGQLHLYQTVTSDAAPAVPQRKADHRRAAAAEFGPPARLQPDVGRPFALPLLRRNNVWTRTLAWVMDAVKTGFRR